ncbi:MAG: type II toxin-antitoxin system HicA family toxin [Nanoarchaeota archaeon]
MTKLVPVSGKKMCKLLENLGFQAIHAKGSHIRFKHEDGRRTVVPVHGNEDLGKGLISAILRQIKITKEEFEELRKDI